MPMGLVLTGLCKRDSPSTSNGSDLVCDSEAMPGEVGHTKGKKFNVVL